MRFIVSVVAAFYFWWSLFTCRAYRVAPVVPDVPETDTMHPLLRVTHTWSIAETKRFVEWCEDHGIWFCELQGAKSGHLQFSGPDELVTTAFKSAVRDRRMQIVNYLHVRRGDHVPSAYA